MSEHKGRIIGYVRLSPAGQSEAQQLDAIGKVDCLFMENSSSKRTSNREQLHEMLACVREGDLVRMKSADRLTGSTTELLSFLEQLQTKGVSVEFVDDPELNTNTPHWELTLAILTKAAQLERATIRERQAAGIAIAKRKGVYDRAPKLTPEQITEARLRISQGIPKTRVARDLGVSRQTLYTALAGTGIYAEVTR